MAHARMDWEALASSGARTVELGPLGGCVQTREEDLVPLTINCWPSISNNEAYVNIEYECQADFDLQNIVVAIPCPQPPKVTQVHIQTNSSSMRSIAWPSKEWTPYSCARGVLKPLRHTHHSGGQLPSSSMWIGSLCKTTLLQEARYEGEVILRAGRWMVISITTQGSRPSCGRWTSSTTATAQGPWSL